VIRTLMERTEAQQVGEGGRERWMGAATAVISQFHTPEEMLTTQGASHTHGTPARSTCRPVCRRCTP
jgi:hypothetical protein